MSDPGSSGFGQLNLELAVEIGVWLFVAYAAAGLLIGGYLVFFRLAQNDDSAGKAGIGLRLLLWPGFIALWPVLLLGRSARKGASKDSAHDEGSS